MALIIQSLNGKWNFEYFTDKKDVKITSPSILLTFERIPEGNNSKFPFRITYGYYLENPYSALSHNPQFLLSNKEEIFILKKTYSDNIEENLLKDLIELKREYNIKVFDQTKEL